MISFQGTHFAKDIILVGVRWYVSYPFLTKAICRHGVPERITINGSTANEAAISTPAGGHDDNL